MKVGILTFQHSINFGAQLQCFGLQEFLKGKGYEVKVINYIPIEKKPTKFYKNLGLRKNGVFQSVIKLCLRLVKVKRAENTIKKFQQKNLDLTPECDLITIDNIVKEFDTIIVGSDQVWGPAFHGTNVYFLDNIPSFEGRKVSYAPCCAYNKVKEKDKKRLEYLLKGFNAISVRNTETQALVKDLINENVQIVQDPTFLYDFSEVKNSFKIPYKKYILTYLIGEEIEGGHEKSIEIIKSVYGNIPVIAIVLSTPETLQYFSWADKTYWNLSPFDWMNLIESCTFFYTDSFHGMTFALKNQKPFVAFYTEEKRKSRFVDFMNRFDLSNVIVSSVLDMINKNSVLNNVEYQATNKSIMEETNRSIEFIDKALKLND